ncbi:hypothetical protein KDAU_63640 [Dictyobacter aurantiacus]|uniref:Uncharacterized protein n=1 Tax=Dictyobacter aurantiacus TaxID=1936993 RepID=A0A401ZQ88_9CHLR|nr:hypothetical protein KDAU_63640 [Dictyobacter aurantiacus]
MILAVKQRASLLSMMHQVKLLLQPNFLIVGMPSKMLLLQGVLCAETEGSEGHATEKHGGPIENANRAGFRHP